MISILCPSRGRPLLAVRMIDTIWDPNLKTGGKIFAQQTNIALDQIRGDWAFHIQADEVIHEKQIDHIKKAIDQYDADSSLDGFILPFLISYFCHAEAPHPKGSST